MKLLILGGTEFLGRYLVEAALVGGHEVTLFNRGQTNPDLFPNLEKLRGNRDGELEALKGRQWDAVIDTCGYVPRVVRATIELLVNSVDHYTFISSLSVYANTNVPGQDESAPVEVLTNANHLEDEENPETYGARKALCEQIVEETMPGRVLSIRAGMLVGPHDYSDRFPYWVRRVAQGGEVLAPGRPNRPVQLIDVRDLAAWTLRAIEARQTGVYNATWPDYLLTMGQLLEVCRTATGSDAYFTWVDEQFLKEKEVKPWSEIPFWLPEAEFAGFFSFDCRKAIRAGLSYRPLVDTVQDILAWDSTRETTTEPSKRSLVLAQGQIGLSPEREQELLKAWHKECFNV
ncbi:SDR family oxidoreductase [Microcoleus sp. FACHB-SPT15]|uniref:SDR family oxidoreductase n=1 Tax=Microcoleus sp. FACHB-SPT15 TaxID=2692830 RepID=UPI0017852485|nr:SDR family oxidoreductase [Microcoleus sp. FACHB-SPT15]MBD1807009.1 SDR family oxidoreductase [Microcoleus sp. FACHB-SPT15]